MPPQISLNELYQLKKKKDNIKNVCFDKIIELCHRRIRNISSHGGMNTFYEIPGMMIGYPLYNIYECTDYIMKSLRKNGLLVQLLPPPQVSVLYISWDPDEIKPKRTQQQALPAPGNQLNITRHNMDTSRLPPRIITKHDIIRK
jgi:hypothetical protein